jgi:hypothetical protein
MRKRDARLNIHRRVFERQKNLEVNEPLKRNEWGQHYF